MCALKTNESETRLVHPNWALFLDVDGTLLDLAPVPSAVIVPHGLIRDLEQLHRALGGALALVTGRSIACIDRLFSPLRLPVAGQHGAELRTCARGAAMPIAPPIPSRKWHARLNLLARQYRGLMIEDKGLTIAVHYRNIPAAAQQVDETLERFAAEDSRFVVQRGDQVSELRSRTATKGTALISMMEHKNFLGRMPIMVGNDQADEDAYEAAFSLGGKGLRVGHGVGACVRDFAAPEAVRHWLSASSKALTRSHPGYASAQALNRSLEGF
ncbi:MAG TPA: trehalose-phosphatase [Stellaceae bacterium]|nr:trehalose-phosphatase [Stellaceae bacterium]